MIRVLITYVAPLIAPFVLYFFWVILANRKKADKFRLKNGPWFRLAFAGLALTVATLMGIAYFGGEPPGGQYQAPQLENGKIIPGHVERPAP